jgi:hypothetical protein
MMAAVFSPIASGARGMQKERIQELVDGLPEDVDVDELIEKLYLLRRLELAEEDLAEGKVLDQEAVEQRFAQWLE